MVLENGLIMCEPYNVLNGHVCTFLEVGSGVFTLDGNEYTRASQIWTDTFAPDKIVSEIDIIVGSSTETT